MSGSFEACSSHRYCFRSITGFSSFEHGISLKRVLGTSGIQRIIVDIFQSQQLLSESQSEGLNFDLAKEVSLLKQYISFRLLVETIS